MRPTDPIASVTDASFERDVLDADLPVLVDFSAEWCTPCETMFEVLATLAGHYADRIRIVTVDVDANPRRASQFGVRGMPSLFLFLDGQVIGHRAGAVFTPSGDRRERLLDPALDGRAGSGVITCHLRYEIDPRRIEEFEAYARMWLDLVPRFGGVHHGHFLPHEGANDVAYALFFFGSLSDYERYRLMSLNDPDCRRAYDFANETGCIRRYDRTFLRPLPGGDD